jgi:hypothetical protein
MTEIFNKFDEKVQDLFRRWFAYRDAEKKFFEARVETENEILKQLGLSYSLDRQLVFFDGQGKFTITPSVTYSLDQEAVKEAIDQENETALALKSVTKIKYDLIVSLYQNCDEKIAELIRPYIKIKINKPIFRHEEKEDQ